MNQPNPMKQPVTLTELRDEIMRQLESSKVVTIKLAERGFLYELIASINDGIEGTKMRNELASIRSNNELHKAHPPSKEVIDFNLSRVEWRPLGMSEMCAMANAEIKINRKQHEAQSVALDKALTGHFRAALFGKRGDAEKFCNIIPKPTEPLTGDEEVFVGGRWVNASTMPNYDNNTEYIWRRNVT